MTFHQYQRHAGWIRHVAANPVPVVFLMLAIGFLAVATVTLGGQ